MFGSISWNTKIWHFFAKWNHVQICHNPRFRDFVGTAMTWIDVLPSCKASSTSPPIAAALQLINGPSTYSLCSPPSTYQNAGEVSETKWSFWISYANVFVLSITLRSELLPPPPRLIRSHLDYCAESIQCGFDVNVYEYSTTVYGPLGWDL